MSKPKKKTSLELVDYNDYGKAKVEVIVLAFMAGIILGISMYLYVFGWDDFINTITSTFM